MTNESIFTAERLASLLERHKGGKLDVEYGPAKFLADLVADIMYDEDLDAVQAFEFIEAKGMDWTAGSNGRIAVRVRESEGERRTEWVAECGTWCTLGDLFFGIHKSNATPWWYEEHWVEVLDEEGNWVQRDVLAARKEHAADGSSSVEAILERM